YFGQTALEFLSAIHSFPLYIRFRNIAKPPVAFDKLPRPFSGRSITATARREKGHAAAFLQWIVGSFSEPGTWIIRLLLDQSFGPLAAVSPQESPRRRPGSPDTRVAENS